MTRQQWLAPSLLAALLALPPAARPGEPGGAEARSVLVELFSSQGCDMCPSAESVLAQVADDARVIPVAFHVDYFNDPWRDPYSDPKFSRREMQYSVLYDRANGLANPNYLYLTPLLMIDGRTPMLGTDDAKAGKALPRAREAIRLAMAVPPGISIALALKGEPDAEGRSLEVVVAALDPALAGGSVLVEVVPYSARTATRVGSGELAGKTYEGRFIARGFEARPVTLAASGRTRATFAVRPPKGADLKRDGLVVIVQDEATGRVHQAARIAWSGEVPGATLTPKGRR